MVFRLPTPLEAFTPPPSQQAPDQRPWRGALVVSGMRTTDRSSAQTIRVTAVETDGNKFVLLISNLTTNPHHPPTLAGQSSGHPSSTHTSVMDVQSYETCKHGSSATLRLSVPSCLIAIVIPTSIRSTRPYFVRWPESYSSLKRYVTSSSHLNLNLYTNHRLVYLLGVTMTFPAPVLSSSLPKTQAPCSLEPYS